MCCRMKGGSGSREGERHGETEQRVRGGVEASVLVGLPSCGLVVGVVLCYQTKPSGVMVYSLQDLLLILSPLQALLSQSQEADRISWVMLRLGGSEQDVLLAASAVCLLPSLCLL